MIKIAHAVQTQKDAKIAKEKGYKFLEVDVAKRIVFTKFTIQHGAIPDKLGFGPKLETLLSSKYRSMLLLDIKLANYSLRFTSRICKLLALSKIKSLRVSGTDWHIVSNICQNNNLFAFYTLKNKKDLSKFKKISLNLKKPAGFSAKAGLINKELIRILKSDYPKSEIWAWTVNDPEEVKRLADLKVDGIITDLWRNES